MVVTGAGAGLGACIARAGADAGYRVGVLDVSEAVIQPVVDQLANAVPMVADVRDGTAVAAAFEELGAVDVLVNNAGILRTGPLIEHAAEDFRLVIDVNLNGAFIAGQAAARHMKAAGGGAIINISSINGIHPSPNCGAYVAAKAGIIGLTQQMSIEWGEFGIRANAIAPGFIDAGMSAPFFENQRVRDMRANAVPLGRLGTAEDVARAAIFLASDDASFCTGACYQVDGGLLAALM